MAFRQPTFHAPQRVYTAPIDTHEESQTQHHQPQESPSEQEWILFSPVANSSTNRTYTATTATRTAGHSRISDFGSFNTVARSYDVDVQSEDEEAVEDDDAEDGELDSLDSHLHEFRSEPSVYRRSAEASRTVLPTHDGLGSFRIDTSGEEVQEHLYAFERFNPRRIKRRRESLELGQLELENDRVADAERIRRIEKWRMEQSRVLVDEIQKETRRRRLSMSTDKRSLVQDREQEDMATLSTIDSEHGDIVDPESETFWNRITRRVIRDLMGIDDDLLSILFGESLPEDDDLSTTPPASHSIRLQNGLIPAAQYDKSSWEHKLLERIAKELGMLVNQISDHPGAFNTYIHNQQLSLPYAGLPVIPETSKDQTPVQTNLQPSTNPLNPIFHPTIQAQPLPIPQSTISLSQTDDNATPRQSIMTREEWEADLDIKMVFHYLRNRFTSKFRTAPSTATSKSTIYTPSNLATASTADTAARAARVRQHHPLVRDNRRKSIERRTWKVSVPEGGSFKTTRSVGRRGSSSCASERGVGVGVGLGLAGVRSGSSRHYWDFGPQSVGSGSLITSAGGGGGNMGSWGEV